MPYFQRNPHLAIPFRPSALGEFETGIGWVLMQRSPEILEVDTAHALHRSHRPVASLFSVHASWLPFHHLFLRGHHAQLEQTHNGLAMQLQWILNLGLKNLNVQGDSYVLWSGFLSWSQGSHHNQWNRWPKNTIGLLQTWKVDQLALSDFLPSTSCLHTLTARCVAAVQAIVGDGCCSQSSMKQMPATCVRSECI